MSASPLLTMRDGYTFTLSDTEPVSEFLSDLAANEVSPLADKTR